MLADRGVSLGVLEDTWTLFHNAVRLECSSCGSDVRRPSQSDHAGLGRSHALRCDGELDRQKSGLCDNEDGNEVVCAQARVPIKPARGRGGHDPQASGGEGDMACARETDVA